MTINATIAPELQKLQQTSAYIELYTLDASMITGGSVYRFTNHPNAVGAGLTFGGVTYQPFPIITSGWEYNSSGQAMARPTVQISNVTKAVLAAVQNLGDLVGAKFTRIRTYEKFLDTGSNPNSSAFLGPDVYYIEQLTYMDNKSIMWELSSSIDRLGQRFPRRQILKDQTQRNLWAPGVARTRIR